MAVLVVAGLCRAPDGVDFKQFSHTAFTVIRHSSFSPTSCSFFPLRSKTSCVTTITHPLEKAVSIPSLKT